MKIAGEYSFNKGKQVVKSQYAAELREIKRVIAAVDSSVVKTKVSEEKTMRGKMLYHPPSLNHAFKDEFAKLGWANRRVKCKYPTQYYIKGYADAVSSAGAFREIDFVKNRLGIEVQFGKYAFMVYNVAAKMTIFHNLNIIDAGVEIVPVKDFVEDMSSGVSYFEQFVWDLEQRGVSNIDIPVLILGITK